MNHMTLDGVMQGPGRADEDTRGGFTQGGWGHRSARAGDAAAKAMGERMAAGGGLAGWLFGRRTYEELLSHWNAQGGPFKDALNDSPKYVASTTSPNRCLGQTRRCCAAMSWTPCARSRRNGGVLAIMGSGELIGSLMAADLIDEYLLMVHPLVLGSGRRLFPERGARAAAAYRQRHHGHRRVDRHLRAGEGLDVDEASANRPDRRALPTR